MSKTTTRPSVSNLKGLIQVTELHLVNSLGNDTMAKVFCDTACSNSFCDIACSRLGLHGTTLNLIIKGLNSEEVHDTKLVGLNVTPRDNQAFIPFKMSP